MTAKDRRRAKKRSAPRRREAKPRALPRIARAAGPQPDRGEGKRCTIHKCWCVITSVRWSVWDPDYVCPMCNPDYILAKPETKQAVDEVMSEW